MNEPLNLIDELALLQVIRWFAKKTCECNGCHAKAKDMAEQQAKLIKVARQIRKTLPRN